MNPSTADEVEQLRVYMPILVRSSGVTEWERDFCASIISQQWHGREPSEKQIAVMRRLVAKFKATMPPPTIPQWHDDEDYAFDLIERGDTRE